MFSEAYQNDETVRAEISTFVRKNSNGTLESGVTITGDQLSLSGYTIINGKFVVATDGSVTMTDFTANNGVINGELNVEKSDYNIYIGPNGYYSSPSIEFNKNGTVYAYMGLTDSGGAFVGGCLFLHGTSGNHARLTPGSIYLDNGSYGCDVTPLGVSVSSVGDSKKISLFNDSLLLQNGASIANLGIKNFGVFTTNGSLVDFNHVESSVTMPDPSLYKGRVVFVKGRSGSITLTCTDKFIKYDESSVSSTIEINRGIRIFVSDGNYWYECKC